MDFKLCRAARAMLGISQATLAQRAAISLRTIAAFEAGDSTVRAATINRLRSALEDSGCVFRDDGSVVSAETVADNFPLINNPTTAQKAEYAIACHRIALAGGRRPQMSEGAAQIVAAFEKALGLRDDQ
jgi:transcriptional regulator with XRE-family HTH domain